MSDLTYGQIAPILRACVIPEDPSAPTGDPYVAAGLLVHWTQQTLQKEGQKQWVTPARVIERLRDALRELHNRSLLNQASEPNHAYKLLGLVYYLLCKPPTSEAVIRREFALSSTELREILSDSYADPDIQLVVNKVGSLLLDLCGQPEPPEDRLADPPLQAFDDLYYLGGLRHALTRLYQSQPPKIAQAQYIPPLLKQLKRRADTNEGGRVLIVAPTNGGKNGIILAAALGSLAWDRGPVVVLQPYRAQISESLRTWGDSVSGTPIHRARRDKMGNITVAGSSSTITEHDADIIRGRIDLVAIIPEKLAVLSRNQPLPKFCQLLICDEIAQLLAEERGPKLEIVLTLAKVADLPIIAVGAGLSNLAANKVAGWLSGMQPGSDPRLPGCLLFDTELRREPPIEYRVIRIDGRQKYWRDGMHVLEPDPPDLPPFPEDKESAIAELVLRELKSEPNRQILVFLENRDRLAELAEEIARKIRDDPTGLYERLSQLANDSASPPLSDIWLGGSMPIGINVRDVLQARVGMHTRDVPSTNLERIETAFRTGRLRVLCATTTVEAGINLPVDTVVQVGLLDHNSRRLSQRALEQRLGRSGRTLSGRNSGGRGIVFLQDPQQSIERVIEERILTPDPAINSRMDAGYIALLLLSFLGSSGRSTEDLHRVLAASFWGYDKNAKTISDSLEVAIAELRRLHLISSVKSEAADNDGTQQWVSTELGQALSAALLLPHDAGALDSTLKVALSELDARTWKQEVIFAACHVPSLLNSDKRPHDTDVIVKRPMNLREVLGAWTHATLDKRDLTFGFPKRPRMLAGISLMATLERVQRGTAKDGEQRALLRTYVAWLWATGASVDVQHQLRGLTEHVVRQDLAYYLTHVLRAVSSLATLRGNFIAGLRVRELAREVGLGAPANASAFVLVCGEHISRAQVAKVENGNYDALLAGLDPRVVEELRLRMSKTRDRRHDRELRALVEVAAATSRDEAILFDRMRSAHDLVDRLSGIWDSSQGPCVAIDDGHARLGTIEVRFVNAIQSASDVQGETMIISGGRLPPDIVNSRRALSCAVLGCEEFVVLATQLAGKEGTDQILLLGVLSHLRHVCYRDLIDHIAAEIAGGWLAGTVDELAAPIHRMAGKWTDFVSSELRLTALAAPLFTEQQSTSSPAADTGATPQPASSSQTRTPLGRTNAGASILKDLLQESIKARRLTLAQYNLPLSKEKLAEAEELYNRVTQIEATLGQIEGEAQKNAAVAEINAIGAKAFGPQWQIVDK